MLADLSYDVHTSMPLPVGPRPRRCCHPRGAEAPRRGSRRTCPRTGHSHGLTGQSKTGGRPSHAAMLSYGKVLTCTLPELAFGVEDETGIMADEHNTLRSAYPHHNAHTHTSFELVDGVNQGIDRLRL